MIAPGSRVKDDGSMSALILKLLMKLESCNKFSLDIISFDRNNQRKDQVYRGEIIYDLLTENGVAQIE